MKLLYDINSVVGAAKYLEGYFEEYTREEIAQFIMRDIRHYAKKETIMTGTMGYMILFDRGEDTVMAEVYVTPNWSDSFYIEDNA